MVVNFFKKFLVFAFVDFFLQELVHIILVIILVRFTVLVDASTEAEKVLVEETTSYMERFLPSKNRSTVIVGLFSNVTKALAYIICYKKTCIFVCFA